MRWIFESFNRNCSVKGDELRGVPAMVITLEHYALTHVRASAQGGCTSHATAKFRFQGNCRALTNVWATDTRYITNFNQLTLLELTAGKFPARVR